MKNLVEEKKEKAVLVLDIGTSFVKLGLFDINANPIKDFQVKFEHWMTIKSDGTYIFNPKESAELIERGIDELLLRSSNFEIIAFSSDTMASTILGPDNNNEPSGMPDVRFTFSADRQKVERELPLQFEQTIESHISSKRNKETKLVPGVPIQTNIQFSPMRKIISESTNKNTIKQASPNKSASKKRNLIKNMPKEVQWTRSNFMLPSKAAHIAAASAHVPYDRTLPTLSKGLENFSMRLGGINLKQSIDVLPEPVFLPEKKEPHHPPTY